MDKKEKIQELMNAKKPVTLGLIARELGCTDLEAAQALPADVCSFIKDIASFDELWAQMSQWEKVTLFIIHEGHVFEIQSKLSAGKRAMGYYNILSKDAVIGGHRMLWKPQPSFRCRLWDGNLITWPSSEKIKNCTFAFTSVEKIIN